MMNDGSGRTSAGIAYVGQPQQSASAGAVLYVKDLERMAAFYAGVVRLPTAQRESDFIVLEGPSFQLVIVRIPPAVAGNIVVTDPPQRRTQTPVKLAFVVSDLDEAASRVERAGGMPDPGGRDWQFGLWRVRDAQDPEGNVFQLRQLTMGMKSS